MEGGCFMAAPDDERHHSRQAQFRSRIAMPDLPLITLMVLAAAFTIEITWLIHA
jgi:hypothetical protein